MALSSSVVWEVQSGGNDAFGGGYAGDSSLAAPSAPSLSTATTGGTVAANTYYCVIVYKNDGAVEGPKSPESSITTTGATSTITVTKPAASSGANTWAAYFGTVSGGPYFQQGTSLSLSSDRVVTSTPPTSGTQPFGTDRSQSTSAQVVIDNVLITCTTPGANSNTLTFTLGYTPTAADVGNVFQATGGTNINAGFYQITGWTTTTWTVIGATNLTTAGGAGALVTGNMGGCLASPGMAGSAFVAGNTMYVKAATYTMSTSNNVSGGRLTISAASSLGANNRILGYQSTRLDFGTKPVLQPSANSTTLLTVSGQNTILDNFEFQVNGKTGCTAISWSGVQGWVRRCYNNGVQTAFTITGSNTLVEYCESSGAATLSFQAGTGTGIRFVDCYAHGTTGGTADFNFNFTQGSSCLRCISNGPSGHGFNSSTNSAACNWSFCTAYGSSGNSGFNLTGSGVAESCLAVGNGNYGFSNNGSTTGAFALCVRLLNCGSYNNTSGDYDTHVVVTGFLSCSANPFTNAAGGDFTLNNAAGGGALLRGAGWPATYPGLSPTNYPNVGAYDPATQAASSPNHGIFTGGKL